MHCPKCNGEMRTYDKLGIHVEQCQNCRGIFLDYGELEQIVAAEQQHYASAPPPLDSDQPGTPAAPSPPAAPPAGAPGAPPSPGQPIGQPAGYGYGYGRPDSPGPYGGRPDSPSPFGFGDRSRYGSRRKKSIFEQLFD